MHSTGLYRTYLSTFILFCGILLAGLIPDASAQGRSEAWKERAQRSQQQYEQYMERRREAIQKFAREQKRKFRAMIERARRAGVPTRLTNDAGTVVAVLYDLPKSGPPIYVSPVSNTQSAELINTKQLWQSEVSEWSLTGYQQDIGLWEVGGRPLESHQEFTINGVSRVQYEDTTSVPSDGHATHVTGTMIAEGQKDVAHGMASEAEVFAWEAGKDTGEMATASQRGASPIRLSNHSYGERRGWENFNGPLGPGWYWYGDIDVDPNREEDFRFGFYSQKSEDWDETVHNNEYLLPVVSAGNERNEGPSDFDQPVDHWFMDNGSWVLAQFESRPQDCSQGNAGYDCLDGISVTKNPLVVGALKDDGVTPTSFTSFGPTDDGRIKPDLMANGKTVKSPVSGSNTAYDTKDGTSMAAPAVTGSIALLKELLGSAKYQASTLKAILLHTADNFIGPKSGPDYKTGWGRMNTERAADVIKTEVNAPDTVHVVDQVTLDDGTTREFEVTTTESLESLRATIAWTDPPGDSPFDQVDPSDKMLVNDLDLRVIRKSNGTEHRPYKLDPSNPGSQTVLRGDNERDNVEQVFIPNPASGATYTVRISHDGSLNGFSQDFGLVVTGNSSLTLTGGGSDPLSVTLSGPDKLNTGENGTWSAGVFGGSGSTSYDWEYQSPGSDTWKSASCSGPDCTRSFSNNDDQAKTGRIRVTVTKGNEIDTAFQTVEVTPPPDLYVDISGSFNLDSWEEGYWSAYTSGGIGSISYSWEVNQTWSSTWSYANCSGVSCSYSFINTCDATKTAQIRVIATTQTQADTSAQTVLVSGSGGGTLTAGDVQPNAPPCPSEDPDPIVASKASQGVGLAGVRLQAKPAEGREVLLSWQAGSSAPQAPVTVQHRSDSTAAWTDLGTVRPADSVGTGAENGPAYQFQTDRLDPGPHQFRLAYAAPGPTKQSMRATQAVTATVEMNEAYRLSTYPNPVRERATVELAVKEQQEVTVQVYDVLGRAVTTLHEGPMRAQQPERLSLDASEVGLSSGTYFVRVQGEDFVTTKRLTIVR
jgi:hypothetical protein